MGNILEIDLSKYGCTCLNQEDGAFLDFFEDIKSKNNPSVNSLFSTENKNKTNESSTLHTTTNKKYKYETIYIPNSNLEKENSLINNKNYLKEFDFSYTEMNLTNMTNMTNKINESKTKTKNEEDEDIDNFNSNTDYYQLAHQISESITQLKNNLKKEKNKEITDFNSVLSKVGKTADIICFNDVIGCIKKISDINSEINLINEKIFLGLVNKFNKKYNSTHFINFYDEEKIVEIPNFEGISPEVKKKFGKFNNPKFKFSKFSLKGPFPNEILIWKVISKNMDKIKNIINDNYYCCAVLLYQGKNNIDNETIIYFINKI